MGKFLPALQLLGIGWYFATCIVFGVVGGRWLDGQLGTDPALTLVGVALGLAAVAWGGYHMLRQALRPRRRL